METTTMTNTPTNTNTNEDENGYNLDYLDLFTNFEPSDAFKQMLKKQKDHSKIIKAMDQLSTRSQILHIQWTLKHVQKGSMLHFMAQELKPITRETQLVRANWKQHGDDKMMDKAYFSCRRKGGSTCGNLFGVGYETQEQQCIQTVHPEIKDIGAQPACIFGNLTEDEVEKAFIDYRQSQCGIETDEEGYILQSIKAQHYGLVCNKNCPIKQHSPDGVLLEYWTHPETKKTKVTKRLIEYKSRWGLREKWELRLSEDDYEDEDWDLLEHYQTEFGLKRLLDYRKTPLNIYPLSKIKKTSDPQIILPVPSQYYAQVQNGMDILGDAGLCDKTFAWFVVWLPAVYRQPNPESVKTDASVLSSPDSSSSFPDSSNGPFIVQKSGFEETSETVNGRYGTIQITKVPFNESYARDLDNVSTHVYIQKIMPAQYWKKQKMLPVGALVPPVTLETFGFTSSQSIGQRRQTRTQQLQKRHAKLEKLKAAKRAAKSQRREAARQLHQQNRYNKAREQEKEYEKEKELEDNDDANIVDNDDQLSPVKKAKHDVNNPFGLTLPVRTKAQYLAEKERFAQYEQEAETMKTEQDEKRKAKSDPMNVLKMF